MASERDVVRRRPRQVAVAERKSTPLTLPLELRNFHRAMDTIGTFSERRVALRVLLHMEDKEKVNGRDRAVCGYIMAGEDVWAATPQKIPSSVSDELRKELRAWQTTVAGLTRAQKSVYQAETMAACTMEIHGEIRYFISMSGSFASPVRRALFAWLKWQPLGLDALPPFEELKSSEEQQAVQLLRKLDVMQRTRPCVERLMAERCVAPDSFALVGSAFLGRAITYKMSMGELLTAFPTDMLYELRKMDMAALHTHVRAPVIPAGTPLPYDENRGDEMEAMRFGTENMVLGYATRMFEMVHMDGIRSGRSGTIWRMAVCVVHEWAVWYRHEPTKFVKLAKNLEERIRECVFLAVHACTLATDMVKRGQYARPDNADRPSESLVHFVAAVNRFGTLVEDVALTVVDESEKNRGSKWVDLAFPQVFEFLIDVRWLTHRSYFPDQMDLDERVRRAYGRGVKQPDLSMSALQSKIMGGETSVHQWYTLFAGLRGVLPPVGTLRVMTPTPTNLPVYGMNVALASMVWTLGRYGAVSSVPDNWMTRWLGVAGVGDDASFFNVFATAAVSSIPLVPILRLAFQAYTDVKNFYLVVGLGLSLAANGIKSLVVDGASSDIVTGLLLAAAGGVARVLCGTHLEAIPDGLREWVERWDRWNKEHPSLSFLVLFTLLTGTVSMLTAIHSNMWTAVVAGQTFVVGQATQSLTTLPRATRPLFGVVEKMFMSNATAAGREEAIKALMGIVAGVGPATLSLQLSVLEPNAMLLVNLARKLADGVVWGYRTLSTGVTNLYSLMFKSWGTDAERDEMLDPAVQAESEGEKLAEEVLEASWGGVAKEHLDRVVSWMASFRWVGDVHARMLSLWKRTVALFDAGKNRTTDILISMMAGLSMAVSFGKGTWVVRRAVAFWKALLFRYRDWRYRDDPAWRMKRQITVERVDVVLAAEAKEHKMVPVTPLSHTEHLAEPQPEDLLDGMYWHPADQADRLLKRWADNYTAMVPAQAFKVYSLLRTRWLGALIDTQDRLHRGIDRHAVPDRMAFQALMANLVPSTPIQMGLIDAPRQAVRRRRQTARTPTRPIPPSSSVDPDHKKVDAHWSLVYIRHGSHQEDRIHQGPDRPQDQGKEPARQGHACHLRRHRASRGSPPPPHHHRASAAPRS